MNLTTKGRYAVTAMLDLAINANDKAISLGNIAQRHNISLSYLEQLFAKLRHHDLVKSVRGPGGGYQLKKSAETIFVLNIMRAVEESTDNRLCKGKGNCNKNAQCITHNLWEKLNRQVDNFLSSMTLANLIEIDNEEINK